VQELAFDAEIVSHRVLDASTVDPASLSGGALNADTAWAAYIERDMGVNPSIPGSQVRKHSIKGKPETTAHCYHFVNAALETYCSRLGKNVVYIDPLVIGFCA